MHDETVEKSLPLTSGVCVCVCVCTYMCSKIRAQVLAQWGMLSELHSLKICKVSYRFESADRLVGRLRTCLAVDVSCHPVDSLVTRDVPQP